MSHSERMSSIDTAWLRMDRPANLMMIVAVWVLEGPVRLDDVEKQIADGLMSYRRYRQKVEYAAAGVYWRDDPNFDLARPVALLLEIAAHGASPATPNSAIASASSGSNCPSASSIRSSG